jgi:hypothetical protein
MISQPLLEPLPVMGNRAIWTRHWSTLVTEIWQSLVYGWFHNTVTVTAAYTVKKTDAVILLNGDITVTLPLVRDAGPKRISVKVINAGGGTRTVSGNGVNIDGAASVTSTTQYDSWDFVNDGSNWFIV